MTNEALGLIEAVREGEIEKARDLLDQKADIHQRDEHGWTALNWAAGRGDVELSTLLLEKGADITATGRDNRTPLMIAKAAGHRDVARILTEAEKEKGVWEDPRETRPYCKAYYLRDLRQYGSWSEAKSSNGNGALSGTAASEEPQEEGAEGAEPIVYLHQDYTVTRSMWHGEDVVYDEVTPEWRRFCEETLDFAIPEDLL